VGVHVDLLAASDARTSGEGDLVEKVKQWLRAEQDLDAAIWTGLESNWLQRRGYNFDPPDALAYLDGLKARDKTSFERAKEYVRNAPDQIRTEVRRLLKERSSEWSDNKLPPVLFVP